MTINSKEIPPEIGVYLFYDKRGQVIYIGKAIHLRRRISQYFNSSRKRMDHRMQQMSSNIDGVKWIVQDSELHALLLEDRLIKKHWPMYNARQKKFLRNRYLALTDEDFPRLRVLDVHGRAKGPTVFGPFPDDFFILDLLEIIHGTYPIRNCDEAVPKERCENHRFMNCSAPCRDRITRGEYKRVVNQVIEFLRGETREVVRRLQDQMEHSKKSLDFERAARLRDRIIFCKRFTERQRFYDQFREKDRLIKEWGSANNTFLFRRGNLVEYFKGHPPNHEFIENWRKPRIGIEEGKGESDAIILDRANVVYSWLKNKRTQKTYEVI